MTRVASAVVCAGGGHVDGVIAEIGHFQVAEQHAAVGVRVGAHASVAFGGEFGQFGAKAAVLVEQFLGLVAFQPFFELLEVLGFGRQFGKRHLVRAPGAFDRFAIDFLGAGPAFGGAQDDHGPEGALFGAVCRGRRTGFA